MKILWADPYYVITPTTRHTVRNGMSAAVGTLLDSRRWNRSKAERALVSYLEALNIPPAEFDDEPLVFAFSWHNAQLALVYGTTDEGTRGIRKLMQFTFVTIYADEIADCLADVFKMKLNERLPT